MSTDSVLAVIQAHPGCSRDDVRKHLTEAISEKDLTNTLTRLRRQGRIQNQGTRKNPVWHVNENKIVAREREEILSSTSLMPRYPSKLPPEIREAARRWSSRGGLDEPVETLVERWEIAVGRK